MYNNSTARSNPMPNPLISAIKADNYREIDRLLNEKLVNIDDTDSNGWSSLTWAIKRDNLETFNRLMKLGASVKLIDTQGRTLLMLAAEINKPVYLYRLLALGAKLNDMDPEGRTALFYAACQSFETTQTLLSVGADPGLKDVKGETALTTSIRSGFWYTSNILFIAQLKSMEQSVAESFICEFKHGVDELEVLAFIQEDFRGNDDLVEKMTIGKKILEGTSPIGIYIHKHTSQKNKSATLENIGTMIRELNVNPTYKIQAAQQAKPVQNSFFTSYQNVPQAHGDPVIERLNKMEKRIAELEDEVRALKQNQKKEANKL